MNERDRSFLELILGTSGEGSPWRGLYRDGSILTMTRNSVPSGLPQLYRPQKLSTQILFGLFCAFNRFGLKLFKREKIFHFGESEKSLIGELEALFETKVLSLLIGNPVQEQRRFLGLIEWENEVGYAVLKVGFTKEACVAIEAERNFLSQFGGAVQGVPRLMESFDGDDGRYQGFVIPFFDGKKATERQAMGLLGAWLKNGKRKLGEFAEWGAIVESWGEAKLVGTELERLSKLELVPSFVQGDYTPWNILLDVKGGLWVIDWEEGSSDGIPALDWVHYLFQVERLIRNREIPFVIAEVVKTLGSDESRAFLKLCGWDGEVRSLVMVYLATNWLIEDHERPSIMKLGAQSLFPEWDRKRLEV